MSSSNKASDDQLETALDKFKAVLTPQQKNRLQSIVAVPDASAIIAFTTQLDNETAKRGTRCVATRLLTFLQSIQQFTGVVDTFVSSNPATAALVWGSVKLAVLLTSTYALYFDKLSTLFMNFSKHCPRYSEYQILYADSVGLRVAVCNFYAIVIDCCTQVVQVTSKSEAPGAFWRLFKADDLGRFEKDIQECKSEVDAEIYRALHQTIYQEQQLQLIERKAAAEHRDLWKFFRVQVDKSNKEEQRRRLQTDEHRARHRKQKLLDRLSNYNYMAPYRRASMKRHGQTSAWLTKSTEFADWVADPKPSIFMLSGKLGSGKTVTTASTAGYLFDKSGNDYRVAYFFCQFDNAESLSASTILSALIRQFLDTKSLPKSTETCLMNLLEFPSPEAQDLGILLKDVLVTHKCTFIIIDAIDECARSEQETLLAVLQNIMVSSSSIVKVFLAVRQGIAEEVGKIFRSHYQASMGSCKADSDIKTYIEDVLAEKIGSGKLVVRNHELINEITDALVHQADGMLVCPTDLSIKCINGSRFLWVAFQIEDVCRQVCDYDIRETLQKLPRNLPETYNRILSKIDQMETAKLAKKIFPWIAIARRPMLLAELREALSVEPLQPYSDPERLINDISQIVSWCGNLIVLDEQDGTVQFTHQTVKMFLLDSVWDESNAGYHFKLREIDHYAGEICVTYLNFNDFKTKLIKQPNELALPTPEAILQATLSLDSSSTNKSVWKKVARLREHQKGDITNSTRVTTGMALLNDLGVVREPQTEHPFLSYAAKYWLYHSANFKSTKPQVWRLWERLLLSENVPASTPWKYSEWSQRTRAISRWICDQKHVALLSIIESSETPFANEEMQCIMDFAIERPSFILFDFVLRECHTFAKVRNESLMVAVGGGNIWATEMLLAKEADVNWRETSAKPTKYQGLTVLQAAAKGGYLEVINKLLMAKADVNAKPDRDGGRTALQAATENGHLEVVERLLAAEADVNAYAAYNFGRTALEAAAENGHLKVVERLLSAKANVNAVAVYRSSRTALQRAAENGHLDVVERLLAAKADVNVEAPFDSGRTALQAAAGNGHLEVVERLLLAKADVNAEAAEFEGRTALQAAAENGHLDVAERLLAANADVNARGSSDSGRTALQAAAENGHLEVVKWLLTAKANVNAEVAKYEGRTALQAAAENGHLEVVERLLIAKADVNAKAVSSSGRTALQAVAGNGHLEVVERLLIAKADVNAEPAEFNGLTALQAAAENGHLEVVERLLLAKAHVNAQVVSSSGRTALQAAAGNGHLDVAERLLAAKADVNASGGSDCGRTALQAAAENGHLKVVQRLLKAKADVNAKSAGFMGRTALQAAAEKGHLEVVERLLIAKADVNAKAAHTSGRTALQGAAENGHLEVVKRLLLAKAVVSAKSTGYDGRTALQAAAENRHLEVVERLLTAQVDREEILTVLKFAEKVDDERLIKLLKSAVSEP